MCYTVAAKGLPLGVWTHLHKFTYVKGNPNIKAAYSGSSAVTMSRGKPSAVKKPQGRKHDFSVNKRRLLGHFAQLFHDSGQDNSRPAFYDKLTHWCIRRWGYKANLSEDLVGEDNDLEEVPSLEDGIQDADEDTADKESLEDDEIQSRKEYFANLRKVSR